MPWRRRWQWRNLGWWFIIVVVLLAVAAAAAALLFVRHGEDFRHFVRRHVGQALVLPIRERLGGVGVVPSVFGPAGEILLLEHLRLHPPLAPDAGLQRVVARLVAAAGVGQAPQQQLVNDGHRQRRLALQTRRQVGRRGNSFLLQGVVAVPLANFVQTLPETVDSSVTLKEVVKRGGVVYQHAAAVHPERCRVGFQRGIDNVVAGKFLFRGATNDALSVGAVEAGRRIDTVGDDVVAKGSIVIDRGWIVSVNPGWIFQ